jgi:hypothetical protein
MAKTEQNNYVVYRYAQAKPDEIVQIVIIDNGKFLIIGKPRTAYDEMAKRENKLYMNQSGEDAFERFFSGGSLGKFENRRVALTERERKKVNRLIATWNKSTNGSRPTT